MMRGRADKLSDRDGSPFVQWGATSLILFAANIAAKLVLDFAFDVVGAHRLEARAAVRNGRGNGALLKMGAVQEGILRRSFQKNGDYLDQVLYAIIEDDWRASQNVEWPKLVH